MRFAVTALLADMSVQYRLKRRITISNQDISNWLKLFKDAAKSDQSNLRVNLVFLMD